MTLDKKNKKNIFNGRILEIEGLENLSVIDAFEFTNASAERSSTASTIDLSIESVSNFLRKNIEELKELKDYSNYFIIEQRINEIKKWLEKPNLLKADKNADYSYELEINLNDIKEPIVACPNDPDNVKLLSNVSNTKIDEVFIGSCMTNFNHYKKASLILKKIKNIKAKLCIAPATKLDIRRLKEEGLFDIFKKDNIELEIPGCSLCMGNQKRAEKNSTVMSTSTRNFPNRIGDGANVYLASTEIAVISAILGRIPTLEEYKQFVI